MQRLRHRLQERARGAVGHQPPPGGDHSGRQAGRTLDLGRLYALLGRALHGGLPGGLLLPDRRRRGAALQGPLHRLRLLLLRLPVRRAAVPAGRQFRLARQDGQVHLLRRRPGGEQLRSRVPEIRPQPDRRRQAADLRRDVLDQGAAGRRRRRSCPRSIASASWPAASAPAPGAGARPTTRRAANPRPSGLS